MFSKITQIFHLWVMLMQQSKLFGSTPTFQLLFALQCVIYITTLLYIDTFVYIVFCSETGNGMAFVFGNAPLNIIGDSDVQNRVRLVGHYVYIIVIHKNCSFPLPGDCHACARNDKVVQCPPHVILRHKVP